MSILILDRKHFLVKNAKNLNLCDIEINHIRYTRDLVDYADLLIIKDDNTFKVLKSRYFQRLTNEILDAYDMKILMDKVEY